MILVNHYDNHFGGKCPNCHNYLLYQNEDIRHNKDRINGCEVRFEDFIVCPCCNSKITLKGYTIAYNTEDYQ